MKLGQSDIMNPEKKNIFRKMIRYLIIWEKKIILPQSGEVAHMVI